MARLFRKIFLTSLGLLLVLWFLQCKSPVNEVASLGEVKSKWLNHSDSAKYVGIEACANCHSDKYDTYIHTGMGSSFGDADTGRSDAYFKHASPVYDKYKNLYYLPFARGKEMYLKEYRLLGKDTVYARIEKLNYIVGSGHHTNSHIINQGGYLYQAPITFYVQEGKWGLPPGYEAGYNSRYSRALGEECLSCHNALPKFERASFNKYAYVPQGIDCERCHGPGSIHIAQKQSGILVDVTHDTDFSIVNPRKLGYEAQTDVCNRCHLQGNAILKDGKTFASFKPGMRLSEVMDVYLPSYVDNSGGFLMASHAERLAKSECFIGSRKGQSGGRIEALTCITCHNPHISVKATKAEVYNSACMKCHQEDSKEEHFKSCTAPLVSRQVNGDNCVNCHMPRTGTVDIPHVTITDHNIRVVKSDAKTSSKTLSFEGLKLVSNGGKETDNLAKAYLYFYDKFNHQSSSLDSAQKYLAYAPKDQQNALKIYIAYSRNNWNDVTKAVTPATSITKDPVTLYQVGQSFLNLGRYDDAIQWLGKSLQIQPLNLEYRMRLGAAYLGLRDVEHAQKEYEFVITQNSKLSGAWAGMGLIALAKGDFNSAKSHIDNALALDPDSPEAMINKVKLHLAQNELPKAKKLINAILKIYPNLPEALGLQSLINIGS